MKFKTRTRGWAKNYVCEQVDENWEVVVFKALPESKGYMFKVRIGSEFYYSDMESELKLSVAKELAEKKLVELFDFGF